MARGDERVLTREEVGAISAMISKIPTDRYEAKSADLNLVKVVELNDDGSILEFVHSDYKRPSQKQEIVCEGAYIKDEDGFDIELIIYVDENRMLIEFELMKIGDGDVARPQWDSIVFA